MLDIKLIRENPEKINELLKRRSPDLSIDKVIEIDEERRKVQTEADELRAKRKADSQKIGIKAPSLHLPEGLWVNCHLLQLLKVKV